MFIELAMFFGGWLLGHGVYKWGYYRGRQYERNTDPKPQVHVVHNVYPIAQPVTRIVRHEIEIYPRHEFVEIRDFNGQTYYLDEGGHRFHIQPLDRYPQIPVAGERIAVWQCLMCGVYNVPQMDECRKCGWGKEESI